MTSNPSILSRPRQTWPPDFSVGFPLTQGFGFCFSDGGCHRRRFSVHRDRFWPSLRQDGIRAVRS